MAAEAKPYAVYNLRDGRQLYRDTYRGHGYAIWHETLAEALRDKSAEGAGWSAVVNLADTSIAMRDWPAVCCATFIECENAVIGYIGEGGE